VLPNERTNVLACPKYTLVWLEWVMGRPRFRKSVVQLADLIMKPNLTASPS
jgi:hypothetical protein